MSEEKHKFEDSIWGEFIYRVSDISQLAKWPLLVLTVISGLSSLVIWYAREDWPRYLNMQNIAYLEVFLRFIGTLFVILKFSLLISLIVVFMALAVFLLFFFKRHTSRMMAEAVNILLPNSFYFGISLLFILFACMGKQKEASNIVNITSQKIECANNLEMLGKALLHYAKQKYHHYPPPDGWCDFIIELTYVTEKDFTCPAIANGQCHYALNPNAVPISRYEDFDSYLESFYLIPRKQIKLNSKEFGFWIGHYMRRPDKGVGSISSNYYLSDYYGTKIHTEGTLADVVLLFETKAGWNQFCGPELLTTEHHEGKGCNVLFNDGHVEFIKKEHLGDLIWKIEQKSSEKKKAR